MTGSFDPRDVIDPREEVTNMLRKLSARRLLAVVATIGVLAAVAPAASLAANGGGGPGPTHTASR